MSADNWTICPRCLRKRDARFAAQQAQLAELYGKVPIKEFSVKKQELDRVPALEETLCEDYELGIDSKGQFFVSFVANCTVCGFAYAFKRQEQVHE